MLCLTNKNLMILFRHLCESIQVVPQVIPQLEQMQHSQKQPVLELSDFNLFPIKTPVCMLEFSRAVAHHFKYLLPDGFNKILAFFLKQKEGEKSEVADAEFHWYDFHF